MSRRWPIAATRTREYGVVDLMDNAVVAGADPPISVAADPPRAGGPSVRIVGRSSWRHPHPADRQHPGRRRDDLALDAAADQAPERAAAGSMRAAREAGNNPAREPTSTVEASPAAMAQGGMDTGQSRELA